MKVALEFEIEKMHCLECPLRDRMGWNNCTVQKDVDGCFIYFDEWTEQMKNCPLKIVKED